MSLIFPASIDGIGRIRFDEPELAAAELSTLAGKRVLIQIKREMDTRTLRQNKFMWGVYGDAVAESVDFINLANGRQVFQTRADVHGFAKLNLLRRPVLTNRGEIDMLGSTTTLSIAEHSEYMERLIAKLAILGIPIPER